MVVSEAGITVPQGITATFGVEDHRFLAKVGAVVVKPARGEQGAGITVGVTRHDELDRALQVASKHCPDVLIEELCAGEDLRIVVIGGKVIAAACASPGRRRSSAPASTPSARYRGHSRRRSAATHGDSRFPLDRSRDTSTRPGGGLEECAPANDGWWCAALPTAHRWQISTSPRSEPGTGQGAVDAADAIVIPVTATT
jgi:hypothetical protein